jgi:phage terminase large subunit
MTGSIASTASPAPPASALRLDAQEALELASILSDPGNPELGIPAEIVTPEDLEAFIVEGELDQCTPEEAAELLAAWYDSPVAFVLAQFRPKPTKASPDGIDRWQRKVLEAIPSALRVAMKACKGPGKSCVLAWVIWWFLCTRPHANVVVTSITRENLRDGLWKELAKWYARSPYLQRVFAFNSDRIACREAPATWWCSARGWARDADPEQQANTMAGLHGDHVLVVHDEVSDYPDGVLAASEGIFDTDGQEAKLLVAGNPTRQDGPLWRVCTLEKSKWSPPRGLIVSITGDPDDPDRSPRINLYEAREAIRLHGREDPWVMTNILGLFPKVASNKLLGPDDLLKAIQRDLAPDRYVYEPKVGALDVAWSLQGDPSVLTVRQGDVVFRPKHWRGLDEEELAQQTAILALKHKLEVLIVDGDGYGHAVYSQLVKLLRGRVTLIEFRGGAESPDPRYGNLRTYAWATAAKRIQTRLVLPDVAVLQTDMLAPTIGMKRGNAKQFRLWLESKDDMKKRGLSSPDHGDSLAMTFAIPDLAKRSSGLEEELEELAGGLRSRQQFDPLA